MWKCEEVYKQIKQLLRTKVDMARYCVRGDLEFLMAMGLNCDDPAVRVKVLNDALYYVYIYGGPQRQREREYAAERREKRSKR